MIVRNYVTPFFEQSPENIETVLKTVIKKNSIYDTKILNETFKEWCKNANLNPELLLATFKEAILNGSIVVNSTSINTLATTRQEVALRNYRKLKGYKLQTKAGVPITESQTSFFFKFYDALVNLINFNKKQEEDI